MPARTIACAALLALLVPAAAVAQSRDTTPRPPVGLPPPPADLEPIEPPERSLRDVSLTLGLPAHFFFSGLEAKGEVRLHDRVGLAVYGGFGSAVVADYYQVGGQLRWYAIGDFDHGMVVGLDVNYISVDERLELLGMSILDAEGEALAPGGLIGYKVIFKPGVTLGFDLGLRRHAITYDAKEHLSEDQYQVNGETSLWWPIADLHVGWSF